MKKHALVLAAALAVMPAINGADKTPQNFREQPEKYWNIEELSKTPAFRDSPFEDSKAQGLRDILVTGAEFKGQKAEFFAYVGYPEGKAPEGGFPAVVLVHGGGGTAFPQYAKLWTSRGFAVIALDWYNSRPIVPQEAATETNVKKAPLEGGNRQDHVTNVANIVLAHSLLRSLENVNPDKTALVGLSWGSWYGAIASAVDPRFKGAVEIYCGDANPASNLLINGRFLHAAKIPMYWVSGTNDQNVTPKTLQQGFDECAKLENKSLVIMLPHSHVGFTFEACFRMADHFTNGGPALPKLGDAVVDGRKMKADIISKGKGVTKAILCYTSDRDEKVSHKRVWKSAPAQFDDKSVWAEIPEGAWQCFLSAYDQESNRNDLCGSTNLVELPQ